MKQEKNRRQKIRKSFLNLILLSYEELVIVFEPIREIHLSIFPCIYCGFRLMILKTKQFRKEKKRPGQRDWNRRFVLFYNWNSRERERIKEADV